MNCSESPVFVHAATLSLSVVVIWQLMDPDDYLAPLFMMVHAWEWLRWLARWLGITRSAHSAFSEYNKKKCGVMT